MNSILQTRKSLINNPIVSHIKVHSLEVKSQGKEIFKAKKLNVQPPQTKSRSSSAQTNFRKIFKISKNPKDKENFARSNTNSYEKIRNPTNLSLAPKKPNNFMEIKFLSEICQKMVKDQNILKSKLENQEKIIKSYSLNKSIIVEPLRKKNILIAPLRVADVKNEEKIEELVTFRPEMTPTKKTFHFPREVFTNKAR